MRARVWMFACDSLKLCISKDIKHFSHKMRMTFPTLAAFILPKSTLIQKYTTVSSANGVMPDSEEESLWTVTSRWRTACLQSSCSSYSSARGTNTRPGRPAMNTDWVSLDPITRDEILALGNHTHLGRKNRGTNKSTVEELTVWNVSSTITSVLCVKCNMHIIALSVTYHYGYFQKGWL